MTADARPQIEALLSQAKAAHAEYERTELGGVYDQDWPRWYAQFMVGHDLAAVTGRAIAVDELGQLLADSWAEQERTAPAEPWEPYTARRLVGELVR